jgi:hypothetical protein
MPEVPAVGKPGHVFFGLSSASVTVFGFYYHIITLKVLEHYLFSCSVYEVCAFEPPDCTRLRDSFS